MQRTKVSLQGRPECSQSYGAAGAGVCAGRLQGGVVVAYAKSLYAKVITNVER